MKLNKVLFVDDEPSILNSIKRSIINEDIEPLFAVNGEKAIEIVKNNEVKVIVTDMKMPQMNGLDLLKRIKEISPDTIRIVLSGYTQLPQVLATINNGGIFKFLVKPWDDEREFLPAIKEAIEYYDLKKQSKSFNQQLEIKNTMYKNALEANKELIYIVNKDINNLKSIHSLMLRIEKSFIMGLANKQMSAQNVELYNEYISNLYYDFLNTIPTQIETFDLYKLKNEIITFIKINDFRIDNEDFKHTGNYRVILFIIKSILNFLTIQMGKKILTVSINSYPTINIVIEIDDNNINATFEKNLFFKLVINITQQFLLTIGGNIIVDKERNCILINGNTKI